jgi:hypothetical protein
MVTAFNKCKPWARAGKFRSARDFGQFLVWKVVGFVHPNQNATTWDVVHKTALAGDYCRVDLHILQPETRALGLDRVMSGNVG